MAESTDDLKYTPCPLIFLKSSGLGFSSSWFHSKSFPFGEKFVFLAEVCAISACESCQKYHRE